MYIFMIITNSKRGIVQKVLAPSKGDFSWTIMASKHKVYSLCSTRRSVVAVAPFGTDHP